MTHSRTLAVMVVMMFMSVVGLAEEPQFGQKYDLVQYTTSDWGSWSARCPGDGAISADAVLFANPLFIENDNAKFNIFKDYCNETGNDSSRAWELTRRDFRNQLAELKKEMIANPNKHSEVINKVDNGWIISVNHQKEYEPCFDKCYGKNFSSYNSATKECTCGE